MLNSIIRVCTEVISWLGAIVFYLVLLLVVFMILFGPLIDLGALIDIVKLGVPKAGTSLSVLGFCSSILYLSLKVERLRNIYSWVPPLLPILQMGFMMFCIINFAIMVLNLWADDALISKGVAVTLAVLIFIIGRAFMSFWYYRNPISIRMR